MTNEDPTRFMTQRRRLASELARLRERSGKTGYDLAAELGWSQSKISKVENAKISIKPDDAVALVRAIGATAEELALVEELIGRARVEHTTVGDIHRSGGDLGSKQRQFKELERTAKRLRIFSTQVSGLLQLPEFARQVFARAGRDEEEIVAAVNERLARQQILFDRNRRFEFVLTEQSLRWRSMPIDLHIAQLDRIAAVSTEPHVQLGVIPWTKFAPVWHSHAFVIFADREDHEELIVSYEPLGGETVVSEASNPEAVGRFVAAFEALQAAAIDGAEARALIARVAEDLRQLGE